MGRFSIIIKLLDVLIWQVLHLITYFVQNALPLYTHMKAELNSRGICNTHYTSLYHNTRACIILLRPVHIMLFRFQFLLLMIQLLCHVVMDLGEDIFKNLTHLW